MSKDKLKAIWNTHIDVQEQLLQMRSVPIYIEPSSAIIDGESLLLSVDENNRMDSILLQIAKKFGIPKDDLNISNRYFLVDTEKSTVVSNSDKQQLSEVAENNHIKFCPNPIIDGIIKQKNNSLTNALKSNNCDYSFDKTGRLQISISDLEKTKSELITNKIQVSDTASAIFNFSPSPILFLMLRIPNIPWEHVSTFYEQ
ncbi:MAG: hypothetical protein ACOX4D_02125 [Bacteroidales bacterium]|jgi:hypothetical protein